MKLLNLIFAITMLLTLVPAQGQEGGGETTPPSASADLDVSQFFIPNFVHLLPHPIFEFESESLKNFTFYDVNLFQLIAVILILVLFTAVRGSIATGGGNWVIRVFRGWVHWLRDELVYAVMGKEEGRKFAPYFIYLFFFIAFMNLLGMVPLIGVTGTASFYVTGTMALITFAMMLGFGMKEQGPVKFFVNLLPHGLPIALIPLMVVVELVGLFVKPFALMVRLFANMLAGHMVIYSFLGMIFVFAHLIGTEKVVLNSVVAIFPVALSVFINIIEAFIALLQAYIFTYLSVIFVQQSIHPAH